MATAVMKPQPGASDEVPHGTGDEHLAGPGQSGDARRYVDGNTANIVALDLDLAGMKPLRTTMPSGRTRSMIAEAQRTARAGPSKVARKPSPKVLTSRPRKRASS